MIKLIHGECLEKMKEIEDNSIDSVITDPPYELGFMGKNWDKTGIANNTEVWAECLRILKPGGYLLSFGGTRTYHRMACAIEDAGFEIRDMLEWIYASGFPKSLNIGKAADKKLGNKRKVIGEKVRGDVQKAKQSGSTFAKADANKNNKDIFGYGTEILTKGDSEWEGWGTALKPAHEPICMARKPLSEKTIAENCLEWGTGGLNIDESRIEYSEDNKPIPQLAQGKTKLKKCNKTMYDGQSFNKSKTEATIGGSLQGRFPANLIHDGSNEVKACFPESKSCNSPSDAKPKSKYRPNQGHYQPQGKIYPNDSGNASRFFKSIIYQAKASKAERGKNNNHPTVKSVKLMEYLINMVTREGQTVLDPFMGSGTTGIACINLNRNFIGIELDEKYLKIAEKRINFTYPFAPELHKIRRTK